MQRLLRLSNPVQHYDWGSPRWIPELTGTSNPDQRPWAELWMGVHPSAASSVLTTDGAQPLSRLLEQDGPRYLGAACAREFHTLPYLFKLLAAAKPLSIQTHPNLRQAREGWEKENAAGIAVDDPRRNYKDANHKPEILCALSPFRALCGFRPPPESAALLDRLKTPLLAPAVAALRGGDEAVGLRGLLRALFGLDGPERRRLGTLVRAAAADLAQADPAYRREWRLTAEFARFHPEDPSLLAPLYLNVLDLVPGEAIYLEAGILHAYVAGFGVELMANSDNVLRCGLTAKHMDTAELERVVSFRAFRPPILRLPAPAPDRYTYPTPAREFSLTVLQGKGGPVDYAPGKPSILLVTSGSADLAAQGERMRLEPGQSCFSAADARTVLNGAFTAYAAATGPGEP